MPGSRCITRKPATRSRGFSTNRSNASMSLTWAASRNFSPPNFTNGMLRRVSSISSGPLCAGCPEQHGLLLEEGAVFAVFQDALDDEARLVGLVADRDESRLCGRRAFGPEVLGKALLGEIDDAVGGGENRLRRAIVAIERDDVRRRSELIGKVEDVAHGGGAERVDRLGVVADHRQAAASGLERQQDRGLQAVRVLVLVDEDVIEAAADIRSWVLR